MDLGYEKGGWWNTSREVVYFEISMKLRLVGDASSALRRMEKSWRFYGNGMM
jgi:hypothetical protein